LERVGNTDWLRISVDSVGKMHTFAVLLQHVVLCGRSCYFPYNIISYSGQIHTVKNAHGFPAGRCNYELVYNRIFPVDCFLLWSTFW
jgi:hypothetical protein